MRDIPRHMGVPPIKMCRWRRPCLLASAVLLHFFAASRVAECSVQQAGNETASKTWEDNDPIAPFLEHLGMSAYLDVFHQAGLDELRYLKKMKPIDYNNLVGDISLCVNHVPSSLQIRPELGN
jgi:hypothetical protein